jgi:hypothetical protein
MDEKKATDLLLAEYLQLQKVVEDFDSKALTIKAWSVTLSAAGIVAAYSNSKPFLLIIAAVSALAFWFVEALWKVNQQAYYPRIRAIESSLAAGIMVQPLQIATSWSKAWNARRRDLFALQVICWPHVWMPHLPVSLGGFGLFFFARPAMV